MINGITKSFQQFYDKYPKLCIINKNLNSNKSLFFPGHVLEFTVEPRDTVVVSGSSAVLDCAATSNEFPKSKIMIQWNDQDQQPVTFIGDMYR